MAQARPKSPVAVEAAQLLGTLISTARRERRWSQGDLAERAGVTAETLRKVGRGNLSVAIGTVFELAALVGVPLFHADETRLALDLDRALARSALLPQSVRGASREVVDDF